MLGLFTRTSGEQISPGLQHLPMSMEHMLLPWPILSCECTVTEAEFCRWAHMGLPEPRRAESSKQDL